MQPSGFRHVTVQHDVNEADVNKAKLDEFPGAYGGVDPRSSIPN
jgi:hypothetical protein